MKQPGQLEELDKNLDNNVLTIWVSRSMGDVVLYNIEKRWKPGYQPRYVTGIFENPVEYRSLAEALGALIAQIGRFEDRSDEDFVWWTVGEGKRERDAALEEEYARNAIQNRLAEQAWRKENGL